MAYRLMRASASLASVIHYSRACCCSIIACSNHINLISFDQIGLSNSKHIGSRALYGHQRHPALLTAALLPRGLSAESLSQSIPQLVCLRTLVLDGLPEVDDAVVAAVAKARCLADLSLRQCQAVTDTGADCVQLWLV